MIKESITRFKSTLIVKQIGTLVLGTASAQLVGILIYPLLTRMYNPDDFGVLELFVSIFSILGSIACLKYEQAIITTKTDEDALILTKATIGISTIFSGLIFVIIFVFFSQIDRLFDSKLGYLIYGIPLMTFITAFFMSVRFLAVRRQDYSYITKINVFRAVIGASTQLLFGVFRLGSLGLILSQLISSSFSNISFYKRIVGKHPNVESLNNNRIKALLKEHIDFPKYSIAATLANSLVLYGTNVVIFAMFDSAILGYMSLSMKLLSLPLVLIGGALSDVFFQRFSQLKNDGEKLSGLFLKLLRLLVAFAVPVTVFLYFILPLVFGFIFGEKWEQSGVYSSILIILYVIRLVNNPFSNILVIINKQSIFLLSTFIQLLLLCIVFGMVYILQLSIIQFLWYYVLTQSVFYLMFIIMCWILLKKYERSY